MIMRFVLVGLVCILGIGFPPLARSAERELSNVRFLERFYGDEDQGQCGYRQFDDVTVTKFGKWTEPVYINTDNRRGGCRHSFAILDPSDSLHDLSITVDLSSFAPIAQCDSSGPATIPISREMSSIRWSDAYRLDTDDGDTGCSLRFSLQGRNDIALDIEFVADGVPDQCMNAGRHTISANRPVEIRVKTDSRPGGCYLRFRLTST